VTHKIIEIDLDELTIPNCKWVMNELQRELVVVIKKQTTDPVKFGRLVSGMSHIANWTQLTWDTDGNYIGSPDYMPNPWEESTFPVQRVTGEKKNDEYTGIFPVGKLDWHANLNGPGRADGVALQGIKGVEGTVTSWLNTAKALIDMPAELRARIEGKYCSYYYNMENWADIKNKKQLEYMRNNQEEYKMYILQKNIAGVEGMYFYINNDLVIDDGFKEDPTLFDDLRAHIYQEQYMYHHEWEVGDIVLSDQLLTLHKRRIETDAVFENRILHRLTFPISNIITSNCGYGKFIERHNKIGH
tara:strand:+ start:805 stop:1707 length:903 start_codon:yes stop_codon:yes gene_type:complete